MTRDEAERIAAKLVTVEEDKVDAVYYACVAGLRVGMGHWPATRSNATAARFREAIVRALVGE